MTAESQTIIHPDCRHWLDDLARWQKDVAGWRQELAGAATDLGRALAALDDHRKALDGYADQLLGEQSFLSEYQAATAGVECGEPLSGGVRPAGAVTEWMDRHPQLWDAHERIKRHHHAIVATTALLTKALTEAM